MIFQGTSKQILHFDVILKITKSLIFQWVELVTQSRKEKQTNDENNPNNANDNER